MNTLTKIDYLESKFNNGYPYRDFIEPFIYENLPILNSVAEAQEFIRSIDYQIEDLAVVYQYNKACVELCNQGINPKGNSYCRNELELSELLVRQTLRKRQLLTEKYLILEWIFNYENRSN